MTLNFDYSASKAYCQHIGLDWFGDDYSGLVDADNAAQAVGLNQLQVDMVMRHHLWQVRQLFDPKNYRYRHRLMMAIYFLTGWKKKK